MNYSQIYGLLNVMREDKTTHIMSEKGIRDHRGCKYFLDFRKDRSYII